MPIEGQVFEIPSGFVLEKVAGPPLVDRPITCDLDEKGRMYVADSSGSNDKVKQQLLDKTHRIVRLEDRNGDGVFDHSTVFADKMMFPEGTLWHDGSLYVSAPPEIWKLTDLNDDGIADERTVWYNAATLSGCANDLHGPYLGRDGWIYWCKGGFAMQTIPLLNGKTLQSSAAHIFRRRPEGGALEIVMSGGMDNPVDVVSSPAGERFFTTTFAHHPAEGLRDGVLHAVYGGLYGKPDDCIQGHPRTGALLPVMTDLGPAAPCGLAWLDTRAFDGSSQDSLVACQFNLRKVSRHRLQRQGASYVTMNEDLVVSENVDFHPTDVQQDADGSLLIVDTGGWYNLCCPTSHLERPQITGGVYRLRSKEGPRMVDPRGMLIDWTKETAEQLVKRLDDPRMAVQQRAVQALRKQGTAALTAMQSILNSPESSTQKKVNAVWTLAGMPEAEARTVMRAALASSEETLLCAALATVALHRDPSVREAIEGMVSQPNRLSPAVLRCCYEALGRIGSATSVRVLMEAPSFEQDRMLDHSLTYALYEMGDAQQLQAYLRPGLIAEHKMRRAVRALANLDNSESFAHRLTALALQLKEPASQEILAGIFSEKGHQWPGAGAIAAHYWDGRHTHLEEALWMPVVAKLCVHPGMQELIKERLAPKSPEESAVTKRVLTTLAHAEIGEIPQPLAQPLATLLAGSDDSLASAVMQVLARIKPGDQSAAVMAESLRNVAHDDGRSLAMRAAALASLPAEEAECPETLFALLLKKAADPAALREERAAASNALAAARLTSVQKRSLVAVLPRLGTVEFSTVLQALEKDADASLAGELLAAMEASTASASIPPSRMVAMFQSYGPEAMERGSQLVNRLSPSRQTQLARMEELLAALPQGDEGRGLQVFRGVKGACSTCHRIGYVGGNIGPNLSEIGAIRARKDLLESIVFPSSSFVRSFEPLLVVTIDGETYSGLLKSRGPVDMVLTVAADREVRIPLSKIEEERPGDVSIMPAGLDKQLTLQELADLVTFLEGAK